jgi:hypothetical protein
MAHSAGWPYRDWGFGGFGSFRQNPRQRHVRRAEPADAPDAQLFEAKQAYASVYLQAGLGHSAVAFVGDVIAQRVEGRWGTKIRDPHGKEREVLRVLVGEELAQQWADWRERGVAERRKKRREEKERRAQEDEGGLDDEGGTVVKPPLADVSKRSGGAGEASCCGEGLENRAAPDLGSSPSVESRSRESSAGVRKSEGVLSFVHSAFKGFLNMSPLGTSNPRSNPPKTGSGDAPPSRAPAASPPQVRRSRPCYDPDNPPGYSLLRSLRMASFAFFVDHPMTNFWTQYIRYNPRNDPTDLAVLKLVLTEAVLAPTRMALLFTWDSLLQRKPRRIARKLRTDFRPAVARSLQVAAVENVVFYALTKNAGLREELVYDLVGLPLSLYINYYQSTVTAR